MKGSRSTNDDRCAPRCFPGGAFERLDGFLEGGMKCTARERLDS
jgi:hypothetical protein